MELPGSTLIGFYKLQITFLRLANKITIACFPG